MSRAPLPPMGVTWLFGTGALLVAGLIVVSSPEKTRERSAVRCFLLDAMRGGAGRGRKVGAWLDGERATSSGGVLAPWMGATAQGVGLPVLTPQLSLDSAPVGFYSFATLGVIPGIVLIDSDVPGAQGLYGFHPHIHPYLP